MSKYKKRVYSLLITFSTIIVIFILLLILRSNQDISEGWSRSISRWMQYATSFLFSWLPFSMFELFVILLALYIIVWLIIIIKRLHRFKFKGSSPYFLHLGIVISLVMLIYLGTAGMEYNRYPVNVPQYTTLIEDTDKYEDIATYFQDDYNEISKMLSYNEDGSLIRPYSIDQLNKIMLEEFKIFDGDDYYTKKTTKAKEMPLLGLIYRELGITGVAFAPTGEANINPYITAGEYAFTLAHEIAHTKGIIREEDANLVAAYICLNSENEYLRYSGYVYTFNSLYPFIYATNNEEVVKKFQNGFSEAIIKDSQARYLYWQEHNKARKIGNFFNDLYLKLNGNKGTISYTDNIDTKEEDNKYIINSYSRYQALYLSLYFADFDN